jgi:hypothetical protein
LGDVRIGNWEWKNFHIFETINSGTPSIPPPVNGGFWPLPRLPNLYHLLSHAMRYDEWIWSGGFTLPENFAFLGGFHSLRLAIGNLLPYSVHKMKKAKKKMEKLVKMVWWKIMGWMASVSSLAEVSHLHTTFLPPICRRFPIWRLFLLCLAGGSYLLPFLPIIKN